MDHNNYIHRYDGPDINQFITDTCFEISKLQAENSDLRLFLLFQTELLRRRISFLESSRENK